MSNRLLIGNLSLGTTESALKQLFSQAGRVESVELITDALTGKMKGFAFVEMSSNAEADGATKLLDGADIDGRPITINLSEPAQPKSGSILARCMRLLQG